MSESTESLYGAKSHLGSLRTRFLCRLGKVVFVMENLGFLNHNRGTAAGVIVIWPIAVMRVHWHQGWRLAAVVRHDAPMPTNTTNRVPDTAWSTRLAKLVIQVLSTGEPSITFTMLLDCLWMGQKRKQSLNHGGLRVHPKLSLRTSYSIVCQAWLHLIV